MKKERLTIAARFSAWSFLLAGSIALFFILDPSRSGWGSAKIPWVKYLPVELSLISLIVGFGSRRYIRGKQFTWREWLLAILFLEMLSGGLYTLVFQNSDAMHSWLGRALLMLSFFAAYKIFSSPEFAYYVIAQLRNLFSYASYAMLGVLFFYDLHLAWSNLSQIYHVESTLLFSIFTSEALSSTNIIKRYFYIIKIVIAFLLLMQIGKFSTYLFVMVSLSVILFYRISSLSIRRTGKISEKNFFYILRQFFVLVLLVISLLFAYKIVEARWVLSSRVREQSFSNRITMWMQSPVVGTFFQGSPVLTINHLTIPSHSDWLDLAAFGGIIGGLLFIVPLVTYLWLSREKIGAMRNLHPYEKNIFFFAIVYILMTLISMAANPILGYPWVSFWFWASAGILAGMLRWAKFNMPK